MASKSDIEAMLKERESVLALLEASIKDLAALWASFNKTTEELVQSWRGIPLGCLTNPRDLEQALEEELYRLSGRKYTLPGGRTADWMFTDQPERLRPFAAKLAEAHACLSRKLEEIVAPVAAPTYVAPPKPAEDDVLTAAAPATIRADAVPRKTVKLSAK